MKMQGLYKALHEEQGDGHEGRQNQKEIQNGFDSHKILQSRRSLWIFSSCLLRVLHVQRLTFIRGNPRSSAAALSIHIFLVPLRLFHRFKVFSGLVFGLSAVVRDYIQ